MDPSIYQAVFLAAAAILVDELIEMEEADETDETDEFDEIDEIDDEQGIVRVPRPMQISGLQGGDYIQELLTGDPKRAAEVLRMPLSTFQLLCETFRREELLRASRSMGGRGLGIEEQVAMFMATVGHGWSNRNMQEKFQRSGETVSRYFHLVLQACLQLYDRNVKLPPPMTPRKIRDNPKFFPYFKNCLGALGRNHIPVFVGKDLAVRFQNEKGFLSQHVLAACSLEDRPQFLYMLAGWEGCAYDFQVLGHARSEGFIIPGSYYYLADAGYSLAEGILTPYRRVRYHLKEQGLANQRPQNREELFNLRHAQLRNAVECIFGNLKRRFTILQQAKEYSIQVQVDIVLACTALYNFIQQQSLDEDIDIEVGPEMEESAGQAVEEQDQDMETSDDEDVEDETMRRFRDHMAQEMWDDYLACRIRQGH